MLTRSIVYLLGLVFFLCSAHAFAHGENITESFPITGAYNATQIDVLDRVPVIQFSGNYDKSLAGGLPNYEARATIANEFFRHQPDDYDFLVTFTTFEFDTGDALAFYQGVRNDTQGIGLPLFDNSHLFGSNGKLQGYIDMAALSRYKLDPTHPDFERVLDVLAHEIWHRWGAFIHLQDESGADSDVLLGKDGAHWSYLLDTQGSVGYGAKWRENGDGSFDAVTTGKFFSPLDLYLMGFNDSAEVPPFFLIDNPEIDRFQIPRINDRVSGTKRVLTVDQIIAAEGPRIPAAADAQKDFRLAFALVATPGEEPTQAQLNAVNAVREGFQARFSILTGGRGVAHVFPEANPTEFVGEPGTLPTEEAGVEAFNLDRAVAWLRGQQAEAGHWTDKKTTRLRDTVVAVEVLRKQDAGFQGLPLAMQWLDARQEVNTDYLARRTRLNSIVNISSTGSLAQLQALQNSDGGWGVAEGFQSSAMDTALVLDALTKSGPTSSAASQKALQYLLAVQNPDGGWASGQGSESRVNVTTLVVRALLAFEDQGAIAAALEWLAHAQNADGGFGDGGSTVHDTAATFEVFIDANAAEAMRASAASNYLLQSQQADGSWGGSVYATALAVSAIKRFSFHNWAVRSLIAEPQEPRDGERVKLNIVVENDSNMASPPTRVRIVEIDAAGTEQVVGLDMSLPIMPAQTALALQPFWDTRDKVGSHTLKVVIDPDMEHVEMSRIDNTASIVIEVQPAAEGIDLAVDTADVLINPASPDELPSQLAISASIRNLGMTDAQDVEVILRSSDPATDGIFDRINISVPGRSSASANFVYTLEQPGATRLTMEIDPASLVADINRSNNQATISVDTSPSIDLEVLSTDLSLNRTQAYVGDDVTLTTVIRNRGTVEVPSASIRYSLNDGSSTEELRVNTITVPAGGEQVQQLTWRVDRAGALSLLVEVDPEALIPEKDESNNAAQFFFNPVVADGPNLSINYRDFLITPEPLLESGSADLSIVVLNSGTQAAENVEVKFYLGDPNAGGTQLGDTQILPQVAAGSTASVGLVWENIPEPGEQLLYVVLDPEGRVSDPTAEDNITFARVQVLSLPDVAVGTGDINLQPANPKAGETVSLVVNVANLGQQPAHDVRVRAFGGASAVGSSLGDDQVIPLLQPFTTQTVTFSYALGEAEGARAVTVVADPDRRINERHRENNTATRDFILQNRDFYVTERYFSPDGDSIKDSTELAFRLQEPADVDVLVVDAKDRERQRFTGEQFQAVSAGRQKWDGLDSLGRLVPDGSYRFRVIDRSTNLVLGEASVEVDTNRSSLFKALRTPYELYRNLTCDLPQVKDFSFANDEETAFFRIDHDSREDDPYAPGVYRVNASGGDLRQLIPQGYFSSTAYPTELIVSRDGARIMFKLYDSSKPYNSGAYTFWSMDSSGQGLQQVNLPVDTRLLGANASGSRFYAVDSAWSSDPEVLVVNTVDASVTSLYQGSSSINNIKVGQTGRRIAFDMRVDGQTSVLVLDAETGLARSFAIAPNNWNVPFEVSPDESKLALYDDQTRSVNVFTMAGQQIGMFRLPESIRPEEVNHISWSADSSEIAFYVRGAVASGYGSIPVSLSASATGYGAGVTGEDRGGLFVATLGDGSLSRVLQFENTGGGWAEVALSTSGEVSRPISEYGYLLWAPGDRSLLYHHENGAHVVFLEEDNRTEEVFEDWQPSLNELSFIKSGRKLIIDKYDRDNYPCRSGSQRWTYQSLLNLTADLRAIRSISAGGIILRGTASDLNFEGYQLEYANQNAPETWMPVAPRQTTDAVDEVLTTWAPPAPGRYLVRLTVTDKAGNQRQVVRSTSWAQQLSITDIYREPSFISPNGDGVLDEALLNYRVLQPVQVEMGVVNAEGKTMRTISRQHLDVGEFSLGWDGRDDIGRVVPDGLYRIVLNQFEFFVTVDNTPPMVGAHLFDAYQIDAASFVKECSKLVGIAPGISFDASGVELYSSFTGSGDSRICHDDFITVPSAPLATDANLLELVVEQGDVQSGVWREDYSLFDLNRLAGTQFRVTATDKAGNRSVAITERAKEELVVTALGDLRIKPSLQQLLVKSGATSLDKLDMNVFHEFDRVAKETGYWATMEQPGYEPMEVEETSSTTHVFAERYGTAILANTVVRDIAELRIQYRTGPDEEWQERLVAGALDRAVNSADVVQYHFGGSVPVNHGVLNAYSNIVIDLSSLEANTRYDMRLLALDVAGTPHYSNMFPVMRRQSVSFRGLVEKGDWNTVIPFMTRPLEDGETLLWGRELLAERVVKAELYVSSSDDLRFANPRLASTVHYPGEIMPFPVKDLRACQQYAGDMVLYAESDAAGGVREIGRSSATFSLPCLEVKASAEPIYAEACGMAPPKRVQVSIEVSALDGTDLKLLTLEYEDDVLFNVNAPANHGVYEYEIDTSMMEEGEYYYNARLVNVDDQEVSHIVRVFVDHTPPTAEITYPLDGQKVCGIPRVLREGGPVVPVIDIEGIVSDDRQAGFILGYLREGDYFTKLRHLPLPLKSPRTIEGELIVGMLNTPEKPVYGFSGVAEPQLQVFDLGGHLVCSNVQFEFDGEAESALALSHKLFAPTGNGLFDELEISYDLFEPGRKSLSVHDIAYDEEGQWTVGEAVRSLSANLQAEDGAYVDVWDGRDDNGALVADGMYVVQLHFIDGCGNISQHVRRVTVDTTPPALNIAYPSSTSPLTMMVEVVGSVQDLHLSQYQLEVASLDSTGLQSIQVLGMGGIDKVNQLLGSWNTHGLEGSYELRFTAVDSVGNDAELSIPLQLSERVDLLDYVEASPRLFSPNNDGRLDTTSLRVALLHPSLLTVRVLGADAGQLLLTENQAYPAGALTLPWDGTDGQGQVLPDGQYQFEVTVALASDPAVKQTEVISVVIDTLLPQVLINKPIEGVTRSAGSIMGTVTDLHLEEYTVELSSHGTQWVELLTGSESISNAIIGEFPELEDGAHRLRIRARDRAANQSEYQVDLVIDNVAPLVEISVPDDGAVVGEVGGLLNIVGSVEEENLATYSLAIGTGASPSDWSTHAEGDELASGSLSVPFSPADYADGLYSVRLQAQDLADNRAEIRTALTVDNTPPVAELNLPASDGYVTEPMDIVGTATDLNLRDFRLDIAPGDELDVELWSELGIGDASVQSAVLLPWDALPPDGRYVLRLEVTDLAGNISTSFQQLAVDTQPPAAPTGLVAELGDNREGNLNWQANSEPDLAGYHLYREGVRLNADLLLETNSIDLGLEDGRYVYTLTATDHAGWEGEHSEPFELVVDLTPPATAIFSPQTDSMVHGLVEIKGTAFSYDDFKEYRLHVGAGSAPQNWQLLRRSPVAIQADVLAHWDTFGLPEDAVFSLRLEAEDINGNIGEEQVLVRVDNLPPATPTGLVATVSGADADLVWNPNSEEDLLGYLLFRDGRLVNVVGALVGDMRPHALLETAYPDQQLPDGKHQYSIAAIDFAGNMSELSAEVEIEIDLRAPQALIILPLDGYAFDERTYVNAVSEDTDIASVQFQFRVLGGDWTNLGPADFAEPWETVFVPADHGLAFSMIELRAVATDHGGLVDPDPLWISVDYRDVTAPDQLLDLTGQVNGDQVDLSWTASEAEDIAGYHVERTAPNSVPERLTNTPVVHPEFIDSDLEDGIYSYRVIAVDQTGNESDPSESYQALVYTPTVAQPRTPQQSKTHTVVGHGLAQTATVRASWVSALGTVELPGTETDGEGAFVLEALALEMGLNTLLISLEDAHGNLSKPATIGLMVAEAPAAPTNLIVEQMIDYQAHMRWDTNPELDIAGYRPYRDGEPMLASETVMPISAEASSHGYYSPYSVFAGNGSWWPRGYDEYEWLAFTLAEPQWVDAINLIWWSAPESYWIEAWSAAIESWVPVMEVSDNADSDHSLVFEQPYYSDRFRILLGRDLYAELSRVQVSAIPLVSTLEFVDSFPDEESSGTYQYSLSAVNVHGFESLPGEPVPIAVGDTQAPTAVTLTADVVGSDVALQWSASPTAHYYEVMRDGDLVAELGADTLNYLDAGLPNGSYSYVVIARRYQLVRSVSSNEVVVSIQEQTPSTPLDLAVNAPERGGSLQLQWRIGDGPVPVTEYEIKRSLTDGGPYEVVGRTGITAWLDEPLQNGERYFYVVNALDSAGNRSARSNQAEGVPQRLLVETPTISYPIYSGQTHASKSQLVTIAGLAEPGSRVSLLQNGFRLPPVEVREGAEPLIKERNGFNARNQLSPDGRYLALHDYNGLRVHDYQTGQERTLANYQGESNTVAVWLNNQEIVFVELDASYVHQIRTYNIEDDSIRTLGSLSGWVRSVLVSPDQRSVAVAARKDNVDAIWVLDTETGRWTQTHSVDYSLWNIEDLSWSPDSRLLVFGNMSTWPPALGIVDTATGTYQSVAEIGMAQVTWDLDSSSFIYEGEGENGWRQLNRYVIAEGTSQQLTQGKVNYSHPIILPDGRLVAVIAGQVLSFLDDAGEVSEVLLLADDWLEHVQLASGGYLLASSYYSSWRVELPGRFEVPGVLLSEGDNLFSAIARNDVDMDSQPAAPITISYSAQELADLAIQVEDITVLPGVPRQGEIAKVSLRIRNLGEEASAATVINLTAIAPNGTLQNLMLHRAFAPLLPGQSRSVAVEWMLPQLSGNFTLAAVIDPYDSIPEASKSNNVALRDLMVAADAAPVLSGNLDGSLYAADEQVLINSSVLNSGSAFSGYLDVLIQDAQGYQVANLSRTAVNALGYGQRQERTDTWATAGVFSGEYQVMLQLSDLENSLVAEYPMAFSVAASGELAAQISTDRPLYTDNQQVNITGGYQLQQANTSITDAHLHFTVRSSGGEVLADKQSSLGTVLPGSSAEASMLWNTGNRAPGDYLARLEVLKDGAVLAHAESAFAIEAGRVELQGSISQQWETVAAGAEHAIGYQIRNIGNRYGSDLAIQVQLYDPQERKVLEVLDQAIDLAAGEDYLGQAAFQTVGLALRSYQVRLRAVNTDAELDRILANTAFVVTDATPPRVEILQPRLNSYLRDPIHALVYAVDDFSAIGSVEVRVNAGGWVAAALHDPAESLYRSAAFDLADGEYSLQARASDALGNTAMSAPMSFVVDNTPPVISIEGVEDGAVYAGTASPRITITDLNLQQSLITLNGELYVSGMPVSTEGSYQLIVQGSDKAGNQVERSLWFSVVGAPQISISGVADGGLYNQAVTPLISISGADESEILLNGQVYLSGTELTVDGVYTLSIRAENAAGLTAEELWQFELDLTPPAIMFIAPDAGVEVQQASIEIIGETEPGAEVTLFSQGFQRQGQADIAGIFRMPDVPLIMGDNLFSAFARDVAGNLGATSQLNIVRLPEYTVELDGEVSHSSRVLVWIPGALASGGASGRQQQLLDLLRASMESDGLDYHIAENEMALRLALRTGRYNTVVLGELHKAGAAANHFHLSQSMRLELQASVAAGTGLVWIKTHPDKNEHWEFLFGAKPNGAVPKAKQLRLTDSPASTAGSWAQQGFVARLKVSDGVPVGDFVNAGDAAMVLHSYGAGPTVIMAFEPNNLSSSQAGKNIVSSVLKYAATGLYQHQPSGVAELTWQASGLTGGDLSLEARMQGPEFLHVWSGTLQSPILAHWPIPADEEQINARALIRLPPEPGTYQVETKVIQGTGIFRQELAENVLTFTVTRSLDVLATDLMGAVMALPVNSNKHRQQRQLVINSINAAVAIAPANAGAIEDSMAHLREALNQLDGLPVGAQEARAGLGYLMQAYQLKWTELSISSN